MPVTSTDIGVPLEAPRFGEYLLARRLISEEQLLCALADHWAHGGQLGAALSRCGALSFADVERLADEFHANRRRPGWPGSAVRGRVPAVPGVS